MIRPVRPYRYFRNGQEVSVDAHLREDPKFALYYDKWTSNMMRDIKKKKALNEPLSFDEEVFLNEAENTKRFA